MTVRISSVHFSYPDAPFRLEVGELHVAPGERVALVGPSGSGKSTLLSLVAGLVTAVRGEVETLGLKLGSESESRRRSLRLRMGLVFQDQELVSHLGALDNVLLPLFLSRRSRLDLERRRAEELLLGLGLDPAATRPAVHLSRGERQRVVVARALVHGPSLILADEPTASLDDLNGERVWAALFEEVEKSGAALLASTHDGRALSRFDRVLDLETLARTTA